MNQEFPNFLMVGTAKAATTSIHSYLKQHPDIFMTTRKEPCFFTFYNEAPPVFSTDRSVEFVQSIEAYKQLFKQSEGYKVRGESSTPYLFFYEKSIANMKVLLPDYRSVKILIILREPVERAYSQYTMRVRDVFESLSFEEAIAMEQERIEQHAHFDTFYIQRGFYSRQVKAYLENFDHVKILLYEDFKANPNATLNEILSFLELDPFEFETSERENVSGIPRLKFINRFVLSRSSAKMKFMRFIPSIIKNRMVQTYKKLNFAHVPEMNPETRKKLKQLYKADLMELEKLIGKDLSGWYLDSAR